jgi:NAD-dependent deacetylase
VSGAHPPAADVTAAGPSAGAQRLAELLTAAEGRAIALTGAGISVPSGIPDFRTPGTGLWANVDPMQVAHIDVFRRDPGHFWSFYGDRFTTLRDKQPNAAHAALAALEQRGLIAAVVTQNIDMLHRKAGTEDLIEVHGTIEHSSCLDCLAQYVLEDVRARLAADGTVPRCDCGEPLKPDVVLFGELLPVEALERASRLAARADLIVCVGSSLEVYPVSQLPGLTLRGGGDVALVTAGPTPYDGEASVKLAGDVVAELAGVLAALDATAARGRPPGGGRP